MLDMAGSSELRKYRASVSSSPTSTSPSSRPKIRDAAFGERESSPRAFRVGALDAPTNCQRACTDLEPDDLISLPNYHVYLRLMIRGEVSRSFSAATLPTRATS